MTDQVVVFERLLDFEEATTEKRYDAIRREYKRMQDRLAELEAANRALKRHTCSVIDGRDYICPTCMIELAKKCEMLDREFVEIAAMFDYSDEVNCPPWTWVRARVAALKKEE